MGHFIDIPIGTRFGRLTVVRRDGSAKTKTGSTAKWFCECDCGGTTSVRSYHLRRGLVASCGCLHRDQLRERVIKPAGQASRQAIITVYKSGARLRGLEFSLTTEEFARIASQCCHYCGAPPIARQRKVYANGPFVSNGIDRVDNSQGYTVANCVPCCTRCNRAKMDFDTPDFLDWIKRVYEHNFKCET